MSFAFLRARRLIRLPFASLNVLAMAGTASLAAGPETPIPPAPAFTSPDIKPTLADWLTARPMALAKKTWLTDPLLKPPFAAAPPDSLKGMAAGIRAVQLDIPNRIKAARYLGTVDCVTYPQAQDMLIATMQEDPSEEVRFEAVMALRNMLTRGCCNLDSLCECDTCANRKQIVRQTEAHARKGERALIKEAKGIAKKQAWKARKDKEGEEDRYDCCRGCANEKVMKALAKVAFEKDEQCCWTEPSERVRTAASEAMCLFKTYSNGYSLPEYAPESISPDESDMGREVKPSDEAETVPERIQETSPATTSEPQTLKPIPRRLGIRPTNHSSPSPTKNEITAVTNSDDDSPTEFPVIPGLQGRCIVGLKNHQFLPIDPQFNSTFEGRTYFFSDARSKAAFDLNPNAYAPAYGGLDPVVWLSERRMEDGQHLREFEGRFFLFVRTENWDAFKANPNRFVLRNPDANLNRSVNIRQELPLENK